MKYVFRHVSFLVSFKIKFWEIGGRSCVGSCIEKKLLKLFKFKKQKIVTFVEICRYGATIRNDKVKYHQYIRARLQSLKTVKKPPNAGVPHKICP